MKASELRIGNWLNWYSKYHCNGYFDKQLEIEDFTQTDLSSARPIPLTEEWLLKFGKWIKEDNLFIRRLDTINDALRLDYINSDGELCWEFYVYNIAGQRVGCAYIKYVHQLQNLYFALTGEELQIKD
jgi:hypothetical protein